MSTRRTSRQGSLRTTRPSDGLNDSSVSGPQPSRRSSRQRLPTAKAGPSSPNMGSMSTSTNGHTSPAGGLSTPQRSARDAAKGSPKTEGTKPAAKKQSRQTNGHAVIGDVTLNTRPNKASSQVEDESRYSEEATIEVAAERLVLLDPQEHNEAVVTDADLLVQRILLPMSLPWCHDSTLSVRTVPHDIDELPGILVAGQKSAGTMLGGILNKPTSENDGGVTVTTRRSLDPGVIELVRKVEPPRDPHEEEDLAATGDWPPPATAGQQKLGSFREALALKRQRQSQVSSEPAETKLISFRFGYSSSRKTLFPEDPSSKKRPLLLRAGFSEDYQRGKRIRVESASAIARELGSYDYRYGLPPVESSSNRIRAGRTRLIWSSKHLGSQRPSYRSMITGMTMESGTHKRPISITVSVRVNGRRLEWDKNPEVTSFTDADLDEALSRVFDNGGRPDSSWRDQNVSTSEEMQNQPGAAHPQCSLDTNKVMLGVVEHELTRHKPFQVEYGDPSKSLYFLPPLFRTAPTEDGVVRTVCWKPGRFSNMNLTDEKTTHSIDATEFLVEAAKHSMACSVCWDTSIDKEDICVCSRCGLCAHVSCHPGDHVGPPKHAEPEWMCNVCNLQLPVADSGQPMEVENAGNSPDHNRCSMCPVVGGVISPCDTSGWCHDVCQMWCRGGACEKGQCALCSGKETNVIRCAAKGCSVRFHPMCAVLSSQLAQCRWRQRKVAPQVPKEAGILSRHEAEVKAQDVSIESMQFKLVAMRIGARGAGRKPKEHTVHLGFCGVHNSSRLPEFYGLPPGGGIYQDAMRVPPLPARDLAGTSAPSSTQH